MNNNQVNIGIIRSKYIIIEILVFAFDRDEGKEILWNLSKAYRAFLFDYKKQIYHRLTSGLLDKTSLL